MEAGKATWPMSFASLPPDWLQFGLVTGAGRVIGSAAVAGSTDTSVSVARTAIRSPTTGVFGVPFLNTPHPLAASAAAIITHVLNCLAVIHSFLAGLPA